MFKSTALQLNNPAWQYFKLLADNNSLGQSYLIYGMPGVGKVALVEKFLQYLFCQETSKPDGQCLTCRQILSHVYQDNYWVEKSPEKQDITIQQIRELQDFIRTRSWRDQFRVVVINLVDEMNTESANALLKILEEPADKVIFLLLAVNLRRLPRTIVSRCQLVPLGLAKPAEIEELLKSSGANAALARELAQYAAGRPSLARSWLNDKAILQDHLALVGELLNLIGLNKWPDWQDFIGKNLAKENISTINSIQPQALKLLDVCQAIGRALLQTKLGLDNLVIYQKQQNELKLVASLWSWSKLAFWLKTVEEARTKIKANGNIRLTFEWLLANLISYEDK